MSQLSKILGAFVVAIFLSSLGWAQPGPGALSGQVIQPAPPTGTGGPAPFATVRVCPTSALGTPCSPLSSLFADQALTVPVSNPYTTDQYGNYSFYLTAGYYIVQIGATPTVTYSYNPVATSDGTVTFVGMTVPTSIMSVTPASINASGTFAISLINQNANLVWANCTGSSALPAFCAITGAMLPPIPTALVPWATPGTIGSTTPNTGAFTTLSANAGLTTNTLSVTSTAALSGGGSLTGTFTGTPTFSGAISFTGTPTFNPGLIATSLTSASASPSASGVIRLARTDAINWRNAANSGDEGMSTDSVDALLITHAGGITLTGAVPGVHFGGESNASAAIFPSGTTLRVRLADNSGDAPLTASTLSGSTSIGWNGITISGTCATNNVLVASSSSTVGCSSFVPASILSHFTTTSLTSSSFGNSNTTIFTQAVTMPSGGCPCRASVAWWMYLAVTGSGQDVAYVSDGLGHGFAGAETATPGSASGFGLNGAGYSPVTYANGANVTFTLVAAGSHSGSTSVSSTQLGTGISGSPGASLDISIYGSN